jgi:ribonucleoside-triphosphate reductase
MQKHEGQAPVMESGKAMEAKTPVKTEEKSADQLTKTIFPERSTPSKEAARNQDVPKQKKSISSGDGSVFLFKTPTCPNCKAAGALLDRAGVGYTSLNANEEKELVMKFGVKQAPTLVLMNGDSFEKYRGVSNIKGWIMKNK